MKKLSYFFATMINQICFYKSTDLNGWSHVKIPLRTSAILHNENIDEHCFIWSSSTHIHPSENANPNRVSNYT